MANKVCFDKELDVRGLSCPMPALRARLALKRMKPGEVLRLLSTDPRSPRDFRSFSAATGHELLREERAGRDFVFYLRRS